MSNVTLQGELEIELDKLSTEDLESLALAVDEELADRADPEKTERKLEPLHIIYFLEDVWTEEKHHGFLAQEYPGYEKYAGAIYDLLKYVELDIFINPQEDNVYINRVNEMPL